MPASAHSLSLPALDAAAAMEVLEQLHADVTDEELQAIVDDLSEKARVMHELLVAPGLDATRVAAALRRTFVGARRSGVILGERDGRELVAWVSDLLAGEAPVRLRIDRFCEAAGPLDDEQAVELAAELLHFTAPEAWWPAARWLWSERSRTGALALLLVEWPVPARERPGERYELLGPAIRAVHESPEAGRFRLFGGGRLATDALLACTYAVYARVALSLRMTREFNAVIPPTAQLARRLLGIHRPVIRGVA